MSPEDVPGWASVPNWLVRDTTVTIYAKAVYLALSSRLGRNATVWPSHAQIAADAGCSERKVRDALQELKGLGVVSWEQRATENGQKSNAYRLHGTQEVGARHTVPGSRRHTVPGPPAHGAGEEEPVKKHQNAAPAALLPSPDEQIHQEWSGLQAAEGRSPGSLSGPSRKSLQQLLRDGVPVERVLQVVAWLHVDGRWWLDTKRPGVGLGQLRKHWATLDSQCPADWAPTPDPDDVEARAHAAVLQHAGITQAEWAELDAVARQDLRFQAQDAARDAALRAQGFLVPGDVVMDVEPIRLAQSEPVIPAGWGSADDPWA